jgi:hypothetical protein
MHPQSKTKMTKYGTKQASTATMNKHINEIIPIAPVQRTQIVVGNGHFS